MNGSAMIQEQMIDSMFIGHLSSVLSVSRNSCYPNIFLSTGDWSTRVWSTDLPCHIASTSYGAYQTTCAMWSPTKVDTFLSPMKMVCCKLGTTTLWKKSVCTRKKLQELPLQVWQCLMMGKMQLLVIRWVVQPF